ncbi:UDP-2,4-diacetamido-2,4,6-trideoxy-beta-L-altropyranose hydrolase [Alishewanella longhuensis]
MLCVTCTSAHALKKQGANCHFACRSTAGNLLELLQQAGFTTFRLPANLQSEQEDASATIADCRALSAAGC